MIVSHWVKDFAAGQKRGRAFNELLPHLKVLWIWRIKLLFCTSYTILGKSLGNWLILSRKLLTLNVSRPDGRNWITGRTPPRVNLISEKAFVGKFSFPSFVWSNAIDLFFFQKIYLVLHLPIGGLSHLPNVVNFWTNCSPEFMFVKTYSRPHMGKSTGVHCPFCSRHGTVTTIWPKIHVSKLKTIE